MNSALYAGIELGGTKTICCVGSSKDNILAKCRVPTTTPEETLREISGFIHEHGDMQGIGIGAFGPINLNADSENYGVVEATPKPGWTGAKLLQYFRERFSCPINLETDVNVAGLAEYKYGAAKGLDNFVYMTVGTGIGGVALINGKPVQGLSHPEMGHLNLPRVKGDEAFVSACPFHENCAEGLASGTAIKKRWGKSLNHFSPDEAPWQMEAEYLAELSHTLISLYSPKKIIYGGGVSSAQLLDLVKEKLHRKLNSYVASLSELHQLENYLVEPQLGDDAGITGALLLAMET